MTTFRDRFEQLGYAWPDIVPASLPFLPATRIDKTVYVSGQIPETGEHIAFTGKVGDAVSIEDAQKAAEICAANILFWLSRELDGDMDRVVQVARITVYINAVAGFSDFSNVGNGASEFLLNVLGDKGKHTRAAIGMAGLPLNVPVEADAIIHVR
ncbi:RidA family protein [Phyllobacterium myrsinacearum]|uniref:Enamine deaminase RidA (YjgF/YER057c/UK114 family) n=1 Tax=Phyllobacterium myrsinacearum TaxID=28101 RepID=A0A839EQW1_9HYPH|nr:RidA family protein [Phyllobacterium myrsinacearum]MBA8881309.1 enamine deaminase RidA (YjgF/YER057c/UK114 family) [Phyllobacterium myrsinacearum]